jgi:YtcA family
MRARGVPSRESRSRRAGTLVSLMGAGSTALSGCRPAPDITVAGSYFPSWMASLVLGVIGTIVFWRIFMSTGLDPYLGPRLLVYPGLVILITLVLWLSVFRG